MKTIVCIIRHGQTDWNIQHKIQGRTNTSLNQTGINQAHLCGKYLKENDPLWDEIYSSPLLRCIETSKIIKDYLNINKDIIIEDNLIERSFGILEGKTLYECMDDSEIVNENLLSSFDDYESILDIQNRSLDTINKIINDNIGKKILIVSHSHFLKAYLTKIKDDFTFGDTLENCVPTYITIEDGKVIDIKINVKNN